MCGLAGIYSHKPVATELYDSLIHLQHRGQDAAGITTYNKHMHKTKGLMPCGSRKATKPFPITNAMTEYAPRTCL